MEMLTDLTIAVLNGPTKTKRVSEVCKALLLTVMQRKKLSLQLKETPYPLVE